MYSAEAIKTASILPLLAVFIPAAAVVPVTLIGGRNEKMRNLAAFVAALLALGVVLLMAVTVFKGNSLYFDTALVSPMKEFSLKFEVDRMGVFFAVVAAFLWVAALAHASVYMNHEENRTRFFAFVMLTEAATLGVFLVHDFFSLFIFFEIMGLAAYPLVIHSGTAKAKSAATKYLYMAVAGGLSLLAGIFLYFYYAGTVDFIPKEGSALLTEPLKIAALVLLIAGFGVKAGVLPLHIWLPDAHPAAPSPASALLSGVMIKAGIYGIIRTVSSFFYVPLGEQTARATAIPPAIEKAAAETASLTQDIRLLGFVIIWIAIITMLAGVVLAVFQSDIKRTLAYSSISQIGFILFGIGCFAYLGEEGAIGLAGSLYHVLNHALFKGALFLTAGSIMFRTHELNMFKLGQLSTKMPISAILWAIATLGIAGIPFFNGFASKTLLHEAIIEAQHLAAKNGLPEASLLYIAEILFIIAAAGTVLYFSKMTYYVFFRRESPEHGHQEGKVTEVPAWMLGGTALLAAGVIVIGLMPGTFLRYLVLPVTSLFGGLSITAIEELSEISFFTLKNIRDAMLPFGLGMAIFSAGLALKLFEKDGEIRTFRYVRWPGWLSFNYVYEIGARGFISICFWSQKISHDAQSVIVNDIESLFYFVQAHSQTAAQNTHAIFIKDVGVLLYFLRMRNQQALMNIRSISITTIPPDLQLLPQKTWRDLQAILTAAPAVLIPNARSFSTKTRRTILKLITGVMKIYIEIRYILMEENKLRYYKKTLSNMAINFTSAMYKNSFVFIIRLWDDTSLGALVIAAMLALLLILRLL